MGKHLGDRARTGQPPPGAFCFEFTTPYHDRFRSVDFCSQHVQNGHFFTTHVENQTVPRILVFSWETFIYYSLLMYSTRIAFVCSSLANLSEIFFKLKESWYKTCSKEVAILYNMANLDAPLPSRA